MKDMKTVNITRSVIDVASLSGTADGKVAASLDTMAEVERRFNEVRDSISKATQLRRLARAAVARAEAANAMQVAYQAEFIHFIGQHCKEVAEWDVWPLPPRRDENNDIVIETPISEDMLRKSAQVMHQQFTQNAERILNAKPGDGSDYSGMFGKEDKEE